MNTVIDSPDRERVFFEVRQRLAVGGKHTALESYQNVLEAIFEELKVTGDEFPKTVVYLPLIWCGTAHMLALHHLPEQLHEKVAQFHAPQTKFLKEKIPNALSTGEVLLVFATEAFGMGADVKDIRRIIHITCPPGIETYLQEVGRAGRDGKGGRAILYVNSSDKANKNVSQEMKDYCNTNSCRRATLLSHFDCPAPYTNPHECCDNCLAMCECSICAVTEETNIAKSPTLTISKSKIADTISLLNGYFAAENSKIRNSLFPEAVTGLSNSLAKEVTEQVLRNGKTMDSALSAYPNLSQSYKSNISAILQHVTLSQQ